MIVLYRNVFDCFYRNVFDCFIERCLIAHLLKLTSLLPGFVGSLVRANWPVLEKGFLRQDFRILIRFVSIVRFSNMLVSWDRITLGK